MYPYKTITLADTERAFLFKDQCFVKVLTPGKHRIWQWGSRIDIQRYDIMTAAGIPWDDKLQYLMQLYPAQLNPHLTCYSTGAEEIALIYRRGILLNIMAESSQVAYWKTDIELEVNKLDLSAHSPLPLEVDQVLRQTSHEHLRSLNAKTLVINVAENKRILLYQADQFRAALSSGQYRYWNAQQQLKTQVISSADPLNADTRKAVLALIDQYPEQFAEAVQLWETASDEIGLVYENQSLRDILPPAERGFFWQTPRVIEVKKCSIAEDYEVPSLLAQQLNNSLQPALQAVAKSAICSCEIADNHIGFLMVDGKPARVLTPGYYAWWRFNRKLDTQLLDCRLQTLEVNGQEILTQDRVSLRINLAATWQITDAEKTLHALKDYKSYLYSELQLALRAMVSTKSLDELLADKNLLNQEIKQIVMAQIQIYGMTLTSVGVKDIILPGEMKTILAQVVEAQKVAEANLIRRREETQATRSLHNTAKVMEGNPVLLRLKELETLERITAQISTLNVYGGLDAVMHDMVKLTDKRDRTNN